MAQYLRVDPMYAQRFSEVWMWSDWPGRDGKGDTGIDLVALERESGEFCAIQCKFFAPDHYLQKADIDSFFTASGKQPFTSRIIISTTDKWGSNAEAALAHQHIPVARIGLPEIAQAPIDWDMAWPSVDVKRYRVTTDKASGIVNDPNDWATEHGDPRYIVDLLRRVVTVSLETMQIVDALPGIEIVDAL